MSAAAAVRKSQFRGASADIPLFIAGFLPEAMVLFYIRY
jgi:hypothetical protein